MEKEAIKEKVGEFYKEVAKGEKMVGGDKDTLNLSLGYSKEDLDLIPKEAREGLGCGNPLEAAEIKEGETVLDLGCGKGMDAFLAAKKVGPNGLVIGVDMTSEMIDKAREIAKKRKFPQTDFRLGEIEDLPVEDNSIDLVISNCVVNLSPYKEKVYSEIFRVLKPGGRIAISDTTKNVPLPEKAMNDTQLYGTCVLGASFPNEISNMLHDAGFTNIMLETAPLSHEYAKKWGISYIDLSEYMTKTLYIATKPL